MIEIKFKLDDDEEIELEELLGSIWISDGNSVIYEECTYVDSWFWAILTNIDSIKNESELKIYIIEESNSLKFKKLENGVGLYYKDSFVLIDSFEQFIYELKNASIKLLTLTKDLGNLDKVQVLSDIKRIVNFN